MRVIGGRWRGRHLDAPEGRGVTGPTTDRVREAMASMVLAACGLLAHFCPCSRCLCRIRWSRS